MTQGEPTVLVGGRYQVEAELGHGGMARVYRVVDQRSGQNVALKQLACTEELAPTLRAMLEREYHTLVQLEHPRIVRAFDYGLDARGPYYTMELLEGRVVVATGAAIWVLPRRGIGTNRTHVRRSSPHVCA